MHVTAVITQNHITLQSPSFNTETIQLLLDTGSDLNLIKINKLKGNTEINENEKIYLKGINEKIVPTIGRVYITLIIDKKEFKTDFFVVDKQFPVEKDGILGHTFLIENNATFDIPNNTLTIKNKNEIDEDKICFTLKPRTETVVCIPIADTKMENKNVLINKQQLSEDVYCANIFNTVKN